MIKDRDELELKNPGTKHTVEASFNIRKTIKDIKTDAQNLEVLQKKEEDKFRKKVDVGRTHCCSRLVFSG